MDFFNYGTTGQTDTLYSVAYTGLAQTDSLKFNWAYALYSASYADRMIVKVSKDGGATFPFTIFDRAGSALATAPTTTSEFVPTSGQWGTFAYSLSGIVSVDNKGGQATRFELSQNYPNPFNPSTTISYATPAAAHVRLDVYDVLGREIATLVNTTQAAGRHSVSFDAGKLASGVYLYRISAGEYSSVKRMMVLR